jgi:hypothetical protein
MEVKTSAGIVNVDAIKAETKANKKTEKSRRSSEMIAVSAPGIRR